MQKLWKSVWNSENAKVRKCVKFRKCKSYKKVIMQKLWKSLCNSENAKVSCKIKSVWFLENAKVLQRENAKVIKKCV